MSSLEGCTTKAAELLTAVAGLIPKTGMMTGFAKECKLDPGMYPFLFDKDKTSSNYGRLNGVDCEHPIFRVQVAQTGGSPHWQLCFEIVGKMRPQFDLRFHISNPGSDVGRSLGWRRKTTTSSR